MSGPAEKVQGTFARLLPGSCYDCEFYELVMMEEGEDFEGTVRIVQKLKEVIDAVTTSTPSKPPSRPS